ncbi:MAG: hypothetical protein GPJ01_19230 [Microcystis aeruginosa LL13-06]|nr:hypothetical protein [Microcystis aeruginosa LL13-06]
MGRWGDGEMGRIDYFIYSPHLPISPSPHLDGEMGRWGDGEMGRWGE